MMPATYEKIQSTTLSSGSETINFTSIPATYTDLRIIIVGKDVDSAGYNLRLTFNGITSGYKRQVLQGDGSTASASADALTSISVGSFPASDFHLFSQIDMLGYAGSRLKTAVITSANDRNGSGSILMQAYYLTGSTAAITSLQFFVANPGQMRTGTTITLYGILKA